MTLIFPTRDEARAERMSRSLGVFMREAWPVLEPSASDLERRPLRGKTVSPVHLDMIAEVIGWQAWLADRGRRSNQTADRSRSTSP